MSFYKSIDSAPSSCFGIVYVARAMFVFCTIVFWKTHNQLLCAPRNRRMGSGSFQGVQCRPFDPVHVKMWMNLLQPLESFLHWDNTTGEFPNQKRSTNLPKTAPSRKFLIFTLTWMFQQVSKRLGSVGFKTYILLNGIPWGYNSLILNLLPALTNGTSIQVGRKDHRVKSSVGRSDLRLKRPQNLLACRWRKRRRWVFSVGWWVEEGAATNKSPGCFFSTQLEVIWTKMVLGLMFNKLGKIAFSFTSMFQFEVVKPRP